ncbi:MAG: hypothetical protein EAX90_01460 [Candidatus Heimdallarchaeota archaeon]|nr:hypothetical protein [Candidatus Heimdallarchaeota archaeon]
MKIQSYNFFNPEAKSKIDLTDFLMKRFEQTDSVIKYFNILRSNMLGDYLLAFQTRLADVIKESQFNIDKLNLTVMEQNLTLLQEYRELEEVIIHFVVRILDLPHDLDALNDEIEVLYFNTRKASLHLSYFIVKAFEDILGKEEGSAVYKQIIGLQIKEAHESDTSEKPLDPTKVTRHNSREFILKHYNDFGVANFTLVIFDDYKEFYKFDRCVVHEVLKDFNDPDLTYLCSCYPRDHPNNNDGCIVHLRRTQTLHHGDFCDELYWNNFIHPNAKQPSLEFAERLGKENPAKLINEYQNNFHQKD